VAGDRERLRRTFDSAADLYERARPDYPAELYGELVRLTNLRRDDRLLEVGCATGKAMAPLARLGFRITCIEVGDELAKVARRNLEPFRAVKVIRAAFEDWTPGPAAQFDLVFAATAWHWIDPKIRYEKAAELLRPGGHLAFWSATHVFPEGGDPFFQEIQEVYDEIGVYNADEYLALLDTFSGHIAMASWQRDRLYAEIRRRLGQRPDGRLRRHWGTVLHVARRRESPLSGVI
jgi:SAM-dependent methyltransferase